MNQNQERKVSGLEFTAGKHVYFGRGPMEFIGTVVSSTNDEVVCRGVEIGCEATVEQEVKIQYLEGLRVLDDAEWARRTEKEPALQNRKVVGTRTLSHMDVLNFIATASASELATVAAFDGMCRKDREDLASKLCRIATTLQTGWRWVKPLCSEQFMIVLSKDCRASEIQRELFRMGCGFDNGDPENLSREISPGGIAALHVTTRGVLSISLYTEADQKYRDERCASVLKVPPDLVFTAESLADLVDKALSQQRKVSEEQLDDRAAMQEERERIKAIKPGITPIQLREMVVGNFAIRWGMFGDDVAEIYDKFRFEDEPRKVLEGEVTYLTNACGEDTGNGTLELSKSDYKKVAFEQGPECVIPYIVEISGVKYVLGNLEIAYQDEFWGEDAQNYNSEANVREYCQVVRQYIEPRLSNGAILLPLDENDPGRLTVRVAVPLDNLPDSEATMRVLTKIFGKAAELPSAADLAKHVASVKKPRSGASVGM